MKAFFVLLALFAVAHSRNVVPKSVMTDIFEKWLEDNRDNLKDIVIELINLKEFGNVSNLDIKNMNTMVVEKLEAPGVLSTDISNATITLKTASATANFLFNNVEVPEIGLNLNGAGDLSGAVEEIFVTVALDMKLDSNVTPVLEDFTRLFISMKSLNADLTGINNADENNAIINSKLADFLNANLVRMAYENKGTIIAKINEIIAGII